MEKIARRPKISLYLDTRRATAENRYPLKIQVYYGTQKLFNTGTLVSSEDFENSYKTPKPKGEFLKNLKIELASIEARANEVADELKVFTFEKFEKQLFETRQSQTNVVDRYTNYIESLEENDQVGTASSYNCSINSLKSFVNAGRRNPTDSILFGTITPEFLNKYEQWMIANDRSRTSVGIYLRALRTIFNKAIEDKIIDADSYPFKKYRIPTGKNTKKAIEVPELGKLFNLDLSADANQQKARAFWFFSYQCNGMNIRDISELKVKDFQETYFSFIRHKTKNTTKEDPKPIIVPITTFVQEVVDQYGSLAGKPNDYVFPIFTHIMSAKVKHAANQNFVRFINQHMEKAIKANGLKIKTGTMHARHAFTTQATRSKGLEFAQEALGHTTLVATQNYWAGFESETKREVANMLMNFDEPKVKKNDKGNLSSKQKLRGVQSTRRPALRRQLD